MCTKALTTNVVGAFFDFVYKRKLRWMILLKKKSQWMVGYEKNKQYTML